MSMKSSQELLLARWMREGLFVCPCCNGVRLAFSTDWVRCPDCSGGWPVRNQVPDFFNQYTSALTENGGRAPVDLERSKTTAALMRILDLPDDEGVRRTVDDIVHRSSSLTCENMALNAEINDLIERFVPPAENVVLPPPAPLSNTDARIEYVRHYFHTHYLAASPLSANVRVRNLGSSPWSSRTSVPRTLSGWWGQDGHREVFAGRGLFPVDVLPGASITLPLQLTAPRMAGRWTLFVGLADGGRPVDDAPLLRIPVDLNPNRLSLRRRVMAALRERTNRYLRPADKPEPFDYGEDHRLAVEIVKVWAQRCGRSGLRMLEVGSGTHPHTAWLPELEVLAVDISLPMLELGSLYFGSRFTERLGFICADASNLPLAKGQFDAVAIFSALHHFPEPDSLLSALGELLSPGGVIFLMCEPVGNSLDNPTTVRELAKGINEQVFTLDEYRLFFDRARLKPHFLGVDGASLKAVLARADSDGPPSFNR